jgi:hypothetical protein
MDTQVLECVQTVQVVSLQRQPRSRHSSIKIEREHTVERSLLRDHALMVHCLGTIASSRRDSFLCVVSALMTRRTELGNWGANSPRGRHSCRKEKMRDGLHCDI